MARDAVHLVGRDGSPVQVDDEGRLVVTAGDGLVVVPVPPEEGNYHLNSADGVVDDEWIEDV